MKPEEAEEVKDNFTPGEASVRKVIHRRNTGFPVFAGMETGTMKKDALFLMVPVIHDIQKFREA